MTRIQIPFENKRYKGLQILVFLISLIRASLLFAQLPTATILGVVKDHTGAVAPGVTLTARNTDTGQTRNAVSSSDGSYRFSALLVGNYEVRAEHAGFRSEVRSGLSLTVSQEAVVNFTLEVGAVEQTIAVTAEAPLVNTTSGAMGGLVDESKISVIPLNGRNYADLTLLQPGVVLTRMMLPGTGGGPGIGLQFSSNGAPSRANNYLLDGAIMGNVYGATNASATGTTLGLEGIQEVRIITNAYNAEYGINMGAQMIIVTRSGTNAFHGTVFDYLRNSALDARDAFNYKTARTPRRLPNFVRNNYAGSFGGPIKKDKTFFFATYEGLRDSLGLTTFSTVIPASAKVNGGAGGVPQINPVIKPFLQFWPDPNLPNNGETYPASQPETETYGQLRVDQNFSATNTVFFRFTIDNTERLTPITFGQYATSTASYNQFDTLSYSHIFSPTLLNTARFSFSRANAPTHTVGPEITGPQYSFVAGVPAGAITIGGITGWSAGAVPRATLQNIYTESDDLYYTRGRHALKFGVILSRFQRFLNAGAAPRGSISFANLTSFLLGQPTGYTVQTGSGTNQPFIRQDNFYAPGFYAQDDLRVRSNLTLNLGLRYEFHTNYVETHDLASALRDRLHDATPTLGQIFVNPSMPDVSPRFGFAWDIMGNGRTAVRGGIAYMYNTLSPNSLSATQQTPPYILTSTVTNPPVLTSLPLTFPPGVASKSLGGVDYHLQQPRIMIWNLTVERQLPWQMVATAAYAGSRGYHLMNITDGNPVVPTILPDGTKFFVANAPRLNPNWGSYTLNEAESNSWYNALQVGLTKRLSKGFQFQSAYTFSKSIDEGSAETPGDNRNTSPYPADPNNLALEKSLSPIDVTHNWRFNAIYRLPGLASKGGVLEKLLNGWELSGILALQTGYPFTPALVGNRSLSGVVGGTGSQLPDRPNLVPGRNNSNITSGTTAGCPGVAAGQKLGTRDLWFDPCAFTLQPTGFLGTAGRDILRGPGFANLDFSIKKITPLRFLGERGELEFRAEAFNILNRTTLATPSGNGENVTASPGGDVFAGAPQNATELPLATAGKINVTTNISRQIQLALKIRF